MKPVAILQHHVRIGPAWFAGFLDRHGIPWRILEVADGDRVPADATAFSGLCVLGGPQSVNDPIDWIAAERDLIRDAVARDVPVIGHCLGGQQLAVALGGAVTNNAVREIGWLPVRAEANAAATEWLGDVEDFHAFQWHYQTFSLPAGATRILTGATCANQAYAIGPHLGMQFHVEVTRELVADWCEHDHAEIASHEGPTVQAVADILHDSAFRVPAQNRIADQLYGEWIRRLRP